jgi:hypothetical protein
MPGRRAANVSSSPPPATNAALGDKRLLRRRTPNVCAEIEARALSAGLATRTKRQRGVLHERRFHREGRSRVNEPTHHARENHRR